MNVESRRFEPYSFPESRLFEVTVYSTDTPKITLDSKNLSNIMTHLLSLALR